MSGVEEALQQEFPEATKAECKRFVKACQDDKKDGDTVKEEAEKLLEDYLDWRSCYGLDYKEKDPTAGLDDKKDWEYAVKKAVKVEESVKRAKELEKKLEDEAKNPKKEEKFEANYDIDMADSLKEDEKATGGEDGKTESKPEQDGKTESKPEEDGKEEDVVEEPPTKRLQQIIFLHKTKEGKPITDKKGNTILHVLPALINRKQATAETYGLALCFYLDRKFDRSSEEKMTLLLDVRSGEGWPNPLAVFMVNWIRKVTKMIQCHYPERLESMILFPVPWAAMSVWGAIKRVFKYGIMENVALVSGPANTLSPLPKESLEELVDDEVLDLTEEFRIDNFKPIMEFAEDD
jgi:hypothetical protein